MPNRNLFALARNNGGTADDLLGSVAVSATVIGGGLNDTQNSNLYADIQAYMNAWGVGV